MENCNCVTAAARHRCPHFVYPNCHINDEQPKDLFAQAGFRKELPYADSHVQHREAQACDEAFKNTWVDYETKLAEQFARYKRQSIIQEHYGLVNALKADWKTSPILRTWQELSIAFVILLTMPYMFWLYVRNPEGAHKLPFID